jgi:predicted RNase H-like nuclease
MSQPFTRPQEQGASIADESLDTGAMDATEASNLHALADTDAVSDDPTMKTQPIGRRRGEVRGAAAIAQLAKAELEAITGLTADHVSAVENRPDGWHVVVDLIELRRIPAATDVLAAYEAVLGPTGELVSYRRTRRYFRDQMMEG